jgi:hypothetical protein
LLFLLIYIYLSLFPSASPMSFFRFLFSPVLKIGQASIRQISLASVSQSQVLFFLSRRILFLSLSPKFSFTSEFELFCFYGFDNSAACLLRLYIYPLFIIMPMFKQYALAADIVIECRHFQF